MVPRTSRPGVHSYPALRLIACGDSPKALQRQLWPLQDALQKDHELTIGYLTVEMKLTIRGAQDKVQVQQSLDAGIRGKNLLSR
jgi:hypothetical protein